MVEGRRSYRLEQAIFINELQIIDVVIDPHVDKHKDHVSDELILTLVNQLDGNSYLPAAVKEGFSYFVNHIQQEDRLYRVVWLLEEGSLYLGVITAFRDKGASK